MTSKPCIGRWPRILAVSMAILGISQAAFAVICIVPDNGSGTAQLPPQCFSGYLSPQQVHMIVNGLPPGTTILVDLTHRDFGLTNSGPGGTLGGEFEQFNSFSTLQLQGTGALASFNRFATLQLQCETHIGPRALGSPVQSFPTNFFMMQGQLPPGDPDFDLLRITAGTGFGMPSPGHTTLTRQPNGNWAVDSFFDISYRIEFIGHPGGPLGGMSGSTTGTIRMRAGDPTSPSVCRCKGDSNIDGIIDIASDLPWFVNQLLSDDGDLCADMDNNLLVDGRDVRPFINALLSGQPCAPMDAWETPDFSPTTNSFYDFGLNGHPAIPAGFFNPGSDPFIGTINWSPLPLDTLTFPTDTIVRRQPLPVLMPGGPPANVPIEMVELSLTSVNPITITTGGANPEPWIVNTAISDTPAPGGMMSAQAIGPNGGVFSANINVRPVFAFVSMNDLNLLENGILTPDQVRIALIDTGDPGSPTQPLQLSFQGQTAQWVSQVCGQVVDDGLFSFHNTGFPFIPGVSGAFDPCQAFKPAPMQHVTPGEAHYVQPPNKKPGNARCGYNWLASRVFCRPGFSGKCPPAPATICTKLCPQPIPCSPWVLRIVRIGCKNAAGNTSRGWCFQFYRLRPPPLDCAICP